MQVQAASPEAYADSLLSAYFSVDDHAVPSLQRPRGTEKHRASAHHGVLLYDRLLSDADIDGRSRECDDANAHVAVSLYPADEKTQLFVLLVAIFTSNASEVMRDALVYYLALDHADAIGAAANMPDRFVAEVGLGAGLRDEMHGYWLVDHGLYEVRQSVGDNLISGWHSFAARRTALSDCRERALLDYVY